MRLLLLSCFLYSVTGIFAQAPIFDPAMTITELGIVDSPIGEEADKIIDGTTATKFLDFELADGMGFTVELGFSAIATQIEISTANDFPVRDPIDYEVLGSNDGSAFVSLDTGTLDCIPDRFFSRLLPLKNTIDFQWYQINFTNACDPSGGAGIPSIQLSEVQLYGEILSIADNQLGAALSVFPNPAQEAFSIAYSNTEPLISGDLFDMQGRKVMSLNLANFSGRSEFDISNLNSGLYFLKLNTAEASTTKRLIIR